MDVRIGLWAVFALCGYAACTGNEPPPAGSHATDGSAHGSGGTGSSGAAGSSSAAGSGGASGASGAAGSGGASGASGAAGSEATAGSSGASGSASVVGSSGSAGSNGAAGTSGSAGSGGATDAGVPSVDSSSPPSDASSPDAASTGLRLLELPPREPVPPPRSDDCTFSNSPAELVASNVFVPPAWEIESDGAYVFYTQRAQVACTQVPPMCHQQGILQRIPRCGGASVTLGLPFNESTMIRAGGGKVYVSGNIDGLFRVDGQTGVRERLDIAAECVSDFAANASGVVVIDGCGDRVLRAAHSGTTLGELRAVPSAYMVGLAPETAYFGTRSGIFWTRLDGTASGKLIAGDTFQAIYQIRADARAVWTVFRGLDQGVRIARLPLDGTPPELMPAGSPHGPPMITVADGYGFFFAFSPPSETGALLRAPSAGGPVEIVLPALAYYVDVTAYGKRAYYTTQGTVQTAR
jgi:hypothetical protein